MSELFPGWRLRTFSCWVCLLLGKCEMSLAGADQGLRGMDSMELVAATSHSLDNVPFYSISSAP